MKLIRLLDELKQRHLYRIAAIYTAAAWLALQIADIVGESFGWPRWLMQSLIIASVAGLPVTLVLFWFTADKERDASADDPQANNAESVRTPSLIVLPFECFSDKPDDLWAADALTEDLTTLIARFSDYAVIARNTAFTYKGQSVDVRDLRTSLGVHYVLEGSLRVFQDSIRVTAQLVDTESGAHLWAEQYDRTSPNFEEVHDEVCHALVLKLGNELTRAEMNLSRRKPPAQWGAWELYQQAKGTLQFAGWSNKSFTEVADLLRQAIHKDPEFAPAHAYLALILALGYWARLYPDRQAAFDESMAAGKRAIELAPASSEVLGYVGCALSDLGQHEKGIPIIERAIELNPSNSQAFAALGAARILSGHLEEGIADLRHAVTISPADPGLAPWSTMLSIAESYTGNSEGAVAWAERACKSDPRYFGGFLALAIAYARLERNEEAQRALEEVLVLNPDMSSDAAAALVGEGAWRELSKAGIVLPEPA